MRSKRAAVGAMCGSADSVSAIASMSKNSAPGMWASRYSACGSRASAGMYQLASNTIKSCDGNSAASQSVLTNAFKSPTPASDPA
jgi:hypothetical protein